MASSVAYGKPRVEASPHKMTETQKNAPAERSTLVRLWGVRGSTPVPGPTTIGYGGNTSCVEVRAAGEIIILDAGSGIRLLGNELDREFGGESLNLTLLVTHSHWDHIQGLPFFLPAYQKKNRIHILGYRDASIGLGSLLRDRKENPFFPVNLHAAFGDVFVEELKEMEFAIGQVRVKAMIVNHPGVCSGFRLETSEGVIVYVPDHEPYEQMKLQQAKENGGNVDGARESAAQERDKFVRFISGADVLMLDTQYADDEYAAKLGWGHGHVSSTVSVALAGDVKRLLLFHHDPNHDDAFVDKMVEAARCQVRESGKKLEVEGARESAEIRLGC